MKRPEWVPFFLEAVAEGLGPCRAAELSGAHKTTPYSYAEDHPDFREEWERAAAAGRAAAEQRREARFRRRLRELLGGP